MEFPSPKNTTKKSQELFQIHEIHTQPFELKIEAYITKTNDFFFFKEIINKTNCIKTMQKHATGHLHLETTTSIGWFLLLS